MAFLKNLIEILDAKIPENDIKFHEI